MPLSTALKGMNSQRVTCGDDARQRGFADAGRAPEDERLELVALDLDAEGFAGSEDVLLADEVFEGFGAHALGQGAAGEIGGGGAGVKEAHRSALWRWAS